MNDQIPSGSSLVAYLRDSGGADQELSTLQQEAEIRAECKEKGWTLTRVFRDEARPGSTTAGREAFQEMVRYLRSGGNGEAGIIVWKYSRLARDIDSAQYYKADLRMRGFEIISLKDNVPAGSDGRLMESVIDWMNQRFLEDLRTDMKRGMAYIATVHKDLVYGKTPKGYRRVPLQIGSRRNGQPHIVHRLEPDPQLAPLVTKAFQMRADGRSIEEIHQVVRLYRSMQGYTYFFRNVIYIGRMDWAEITVDDFCSPLVDPETWARVQEVNRAAQARFGAWHPRRVKSKYLLSGFLRCGVCGRPMGGLTASQRDGKSYEYYSCSGRTDMVSKCRARRIRTELLDGRVMELLHELLTAPEVLRELYRETLELAGQKQAEVAIQAEMIEREMMGINRRIGRITAAITEHGHSRAMLEELGKLEAERDTLQERTAGIQVVRPALSWPEIVDLEAFGREAWRALEEADGRGKQLLLRAVVGEVVAKREEKGVAGEIKLKALPGLGEVGKVLFL